MGCGRAHERSPGQQWDGAVKSGQRGEAVRWTQKVGSGDMRGGGWLVRGGLGAGHARWDLRCERWMVGHTRSDVQGEI